MQQLPLAIAGLAALAVACLFLGLYRLIKPAGELEDRLQSSVRRDLPVGDRGSKKALLGRFNRLSLDKKFAAGMASDLIRADLALTVNEYILIRFGGGVAGLVLGTLIGGNILIGLLAAVLALQIPVLLVHRRLKQRQNRFQNQLVDVISMLSSGLKAGVGLVQAMDLVRKEMPAPAATEFGRVVREAGLGVPLAASLQRLAERMPGDDLQMLITVINIQFEVGGNLAAVLDNVVVTIRERVRIAQEIRTLTAMQRATSYILGGLPFLLGGAIMVINPGYMTPMFKPPWLILPVVACIMVIVGYFVISRIVDIKV